MVVVGNIVELLVVGWLNRQMYLIIISLPMKYEDSCGILACMLANFNYG